MSLDWPTGFDRTPPVERNPNRHFRASIANTTEELETELYRLDPDEWRADIGNQHTKSNGLPQHNANPDDPGFVLRWRKDGEEFAVACDAYTRLRDNLRTVYFWVHETRMRNQRPVETGEDEFAAARLPPGDEEAIAVAPTPEPHEILEVAPDAPEAVVRGAARSLKAEHHPDRGGDVEQFKRIVEAEEALLDD
ncbi:DnaJ-like chaperone fused to ferredoxin [Halanaeroarchaeum sp. HSR-CO]|uniref:J domain-containing protein n=1 Tax=Halanaeroarchaeum sp. HSR-CO TaxID=2866382 RepID=UPI00217EB17C|nr:DnaJ domain-containing protein [Halanaeroarchaeum sp. HSR-CO]UWG47024.1 DnaJ-like chaperone fused to ferredoxin [Halanaeroarchaeum sp. HSR-CO]